MSLKTRLLPLTLLLSAVHCMAAPTPEQVEEAKRIQTVAEARKATAEANAAEARAQLGSLDVSKLTPPAAEAKTLNVEANLLAYGAVRAIADTIAEEIQAKVPGKEVVIYTEREFTYLEHSRSFSSNLLALDTDMKGVTAPVLRSDNVACAPARAPDKEAGGNVLSGLGPLSSVDAITQVLSLFKVNKHLAGTEVAVDTFALSAAVADALQQREIKTYYPPLLVSSAALTMPSARSSVEDALDKVNKGVLDLDDVLAKVAESQTLLAMRKTANKKPSFDCAKGYAGDEITLAATAARAKLLKDRAAKYIAAALTPDEKTGVTLMQSLISADTIRNKAPKAMLLQLKSISAGGTTLTKTNFFSASFRFSGGAVVAYMLADSDGALVMSGLATKYGGFANADDLSAALIKLGSEAKKE